MAKTSFSIQALKRWSCKSKQLPGTSSIKSIHVYDFDNTLFSSPLPNTQLWSPPTVGQLQAWEAFAHGGWWHDPAILGATGEGIEKEEPRGWEAWWNDTIVRLVETSMAQKDALTVLLTGRGETRFADLVNRICNAKKLDFDMVVLKPEVGPGGERFSHTIEFKQQFLKDLVFTYKEADEIRVYEDRAKHVKAFREFFEKLNKSLLSHPFDQPPPVRKPITAEVIHVCELKSSLDPEVEVAEVQRLVNRHNRAIATGGPNPCKARDVQFYIEENFVYFGYLISQNDSARLISLCNTPPHLIDSGEVRLMASNILISPFKPRRDLIEKVGGKGNKVMWQVTGVAKYEDRIWAAKVSPVSDQPVHAHDHTPLIVLAIRKGSRPVDANKIQNWQPVPPEKAFIFETVVGEKIMLRISELDDSVMMSRNNHRGRQGNRFDQKRKFHDEENSRPSYARVAADGDDDRDDGSWGPKERTGDRHGQARYFSRGKNQFNNQRNSGTGGQARTQHNDKRDNSRSRGGGGRGRGGTRGAGPGYKSLDDYGNQNFDGTNDVKMSGTGGEMVMNY